MLEIRDLVKRFRNGTVANNGISLTVGRGEVFGLLGPNGAGKSTLFKLISGELSADSGDISLIRGATMGMVRQDLPDDDTTLLDIVLAADTERIYKGTYAQAAASDRPWWKFW